MYLVVDSMRYLYVPTCTGSEAEDSRFKIQGVLVNPGNQCLNDDVKCLRFW